jgi:hypothetical protein
MQLLSRLLLFIFGFLYKKRKYKRKYIKKYSKEILKIIGARKGCWNTEKKAKIG